MQQQIHDEEVSQAKARIAISVLCLSYFIGTYLFDKNDISPIIYVSSCATFSLIWLKYIIHHPHNGLWRRRFISLFDISVVTFAMYVSGEWGSIFYFLFLWIIVGNGMRFGIQSLTEVMTLGVIGFSILIMNSDYWQQNLPAGIGLLLGIIILPCFYMVLIKRLHTLNEQLKLELEKTTYAATHDGMTGLVNREYFFNKVTEVIVNAKHNSNSFSILYIDIDGFKQVNDSYGHSYGDELLRIISQRLQKLVRKNDLVSRLGGDEFAIIFHETDQELSENIAQRILLEVKKGVRVGNREIHVTASVGISRYPDHGEFVDTLIQAADIAMYDSKHLGKNCVSLCHLNSAA